MNSVRRFCCDDETGEILTYLVNEETGEPSLRQANTPSYDNSTIKQEDPILVKKPIVKFPKGLVNRSKRFQTLKANIIAGSNIMSHRLLLIPTVTIFPAFFCVILMLLEIFLHTRCHRKNKKLNDPALYYRSPFHILTSMFCGFCRESDSASKVGQLQDKRRFRYDYLRGIAI